MRSVAQAAKVVRGVRAGRGGRTRRSPGEGSILAGMDRRERGGRRHPLRLHHGALRALREAPEHRGWFGRPVPLSRLGLRKLRATCHLATDLGLLRRGGRNLLARAALCGQKVVRVVREGAPRGKNEASQLIPRSGRLLRTRGEGQIPAKYLHCPTHLSCRRVDARRGLQ